MLGHVLKLEMEGERGRDLEEVVLDLSPLQSLGIVLSRAQSSKASFQLPCGLEVIKRKRSLSFLLPFLFSLFHIKCRMQCYMQIFHVLSYV